MEPNGANLGRRRLCSKPKRRYLPVPGRGLSKLMLSSGRVMPKRQFIMRPLRYSGDRGQRRQETSLRRCPGSRGFH